MHTQRTLSQILIVIAAAAQLGACGPRSSAAGGSAPAGLPISTSVFVDADSQLTVAVPSHYVRAQHRSDCYHAVVRHNVRGFCLSVVSAAQAGARRFRSDSSALEDRCFDCAFYERILTDTVSGAPYKMIRQRALLTGTIGHHRRLPVLRIHIQVTDALVAIFDVQHIDGAAGEEELLSIAKSVRYIR